MNAHKFLNISSKLDYYFFFTVWTTTLLQVGIFKIFCLHELKWSFSHWNTMFPPVRLRCSDSSFWTPSSVCGPQTMKKRSCWHHNHFRNDLNPFGLKMKLRHAQLIHVWKIHQAARWTTHTPVASQRKAAVFIFPLCENKIRQFHLQRSLLQPLAAALAGGSSK